MLFRMEERTKEKERIKMMARPNKNIPIIRNCVTCDKIFKLAKRDVKNCATCTRRAREAKRHERICN